jgi:hypothetical protein
MSVLSRQRLPGPPAYAVVCDECSVMNVASLEALRERGWRMVSLELLPHLCPGCAGRENAARNVAPAGAYNGSPVLNAPLS